MQEHQPTPHMREVLGDDAFIGVDDMSKILGVSRTSIYRLKERDDFPRFIKFGQCIRWRIGDVRAYARNINPELSGAA